MLTEISGFTGVYDFLAILKKFTEMFTAFTIFYSVFQNYAEK